MKNKLSIGLLAVFITALILYGLDASAAPKKKMNFPTKNSATYELIQTEKYGLLGSIEIEGEINEKTASVVTQAFTEFKRREVKEVIFQINSEGGSFGYGVDIINDILDARIEHKMTVVMSVDKRQLCASMCTSIFATGSIRMAAPDSVWVFHSPAIGEEDLKRLSADDREKVKQVIEHAREIMMMTYETADKDFANNVLKPYIMGQKKELVLSAWQIIDYSPWWFDVMIEI